MNTTFVALLFFLIFLITKPKLGSAGGRAPEKVVDTSGKIVRAGVNYHFVPASSNNVIGGLSFTSIGIFTCPLSVIFVNGSKGIPLVFTPVNPKKGVVRVNTDLNINFAYGDSMCPGPMVWNVANRDNSTGERFLTTDGVVGNPGRKTVANWFKIRKYENGYKVVYCPSVCNYCYYECSDIGIYEDQFGNKRLALTNVPYKVWFQLV
ncbi:hypothetical protein PIB30_004315 [Stylosanthes scabra]|uniref:Uncharacterized protein n=1 Tax=Stylosanthes scabra TaxID=79078 RepID=A0ABU6T3C5_9FABA|nr:hypothetical protein [Stylosanthes scabra]